jgi:hypothetical protein
MEMQQMMEMLARMDANMKSYKAKTVADHKELLSRLEADRQADQREPKEMMMKMMDTSHKEMVAETNPEMDVKTMACQEMEAHLEEEPTSVDMKPEAQVQKSPEGKF